MKSSEGGSDANLVIWGTDVNILDAKRQFVMFLQECIPGMTSEDGFNLDDSLHLYLKALEEVRLIYILKENQI